LNDDLLGAADPSGAGGNHNPPILDVLERASTRLDNRFQNDPQTKASIQLSLSNAYFGLSDYAKAELYRRKAIELLTATLGAGDTTTLAADYQLAAVLMAQSKFDAATPLLDKADHLVGQRLNETSPLAFQAHWARASFYKLKNDAGRALIEYEAADKIRQAIDSGNAVSLFKTRDGMSWCYTRLERSADAERVLRDLMSPEYTPERAGPLFWAQARLDYAASLMSLGRVDDAERIEVVALTEMRRSLGNDHIWVGVAANELGELYSRQARWNLAADRYREAYEVLRKRTGDNGQGTMIAAGNLGIVEYRTHQLLEAARVLTQVHDSFAKLFGATSPQAQSMAFYLAEVFTQQGDVNKASQLAMTLDAVSLAAAEPRNDWAWRIQALKGEILTGERRFTEAVNLLEPAVDAMEKENLPSWDIESYKQALQHAQTKITD